MSASDGVEIFNRVVLKLFERLYESFPTPLDIQFSELFMDAMNTSDGTVEEIVNNKSHDGLVGCMTIPEDTIKWLENEGFIRVNTYFYSGVSCVSLTLKTLTILGQTPTSVGGETTTMRFIDAAKESLVDGAKSQASDVAQALFATAMQFGIGMLVR